MFFNDFEVQLWRHILSLTVQENVSCLVFASYFIWSQTYPFHHGKCLFNWPVTCKCFTTGQQNLKILEGNFELILMSFSLTTPCYFFSEFGILDLLKGSFIFESGNMSCQMQLVVLDNSLNAHLISAFNDMIVSDFFLSSDAWHWMQNGDNNAVLVVSGNATWFLNQ